MHGTGEYTGFVAISLPLCYGKYMIRHLMAITLAAVLFIPAMPVPAAVPDTGLRRDLVAGARQELLRRGRTEVLPEALGDWRETIDSVLFMLFRSTELYRGPVRIMVVDDTEVFSRFYPEGT